MSAPLLSVCLLTYNHVKYIREAIDGVLMQKTNFSWELIIADDFSTDGTREIVLEYKEKYPDLIKLILQEKNVGSAKNFIDLISAPTSKYIAYFEGDDYWTDPYKLQKQVDFLEEHQDYGLVYMKAICFHQETGRTSKTIGGPATTFNQLIINNEIPTLTVCFRNDILILYNETVQPEARNWLMGDYPMWLYFALKAKIYFINETSCVYRILNDSASHPVDFEKKELFIKSVYSVQSFFLKYANIDYDINKFNDRLYSSLAANALISGTTTKTKNYLKMINKLGTKDRIKLIICYSDILTKLYKRSRGVARRIIFQTDKLSASKT